MALDFENYEPFVTNLIFADNIPPIEEATERKPYGLRIF
jgi:hypothetical protein